MDAESSHPVKQDFLLLSAKPETKAGWFPGGLPLSCCIKHLSVVLSFRARIVECTATHCLFFPSASAILDLVIAEYSSSASGTQHRALHVRDARVSKEDGRRVDQVTRANAILVS